MESHKAPTLLATSEKDPFDGAGNVQAWSDGLRHAKPLLVPGAAHGMAIYYDVRDEVLEFVKQLKIED
jgi:pimeloyl-ACP methyl ester carboxylesterase